MKGKAKSQANLAKADQMLSTGSSQKQVADYFGIAPQTLKQSWLSDDRYLALKEEGDQAQTKAVVKVLEKHIQCTTEFVVGELMAIIADKEDVSTRDRISALKMLSDHVGGFSANNKTDLKVEAKAVEHMFDKELLEYINA